MDLEKLSLVSKMLDARSFCDKHGFKIIPATQLKALLDVQFAVEFFHTKTSLNLPEELIQRMQKAREELKSK